ncbi:MAG TPA: hypothetical protein VGO61_16490 [Steroidobacteraceae bacterium]|jgi:hypothetical protein|nr:hypothetical protein [Steroidobacteraceae bacterium]
MLVSQPVSVTLLTEQSGWFRELNMASAVDMALDSLLAVAELPTKAGGSAEQTAVLPFHTPPAATQ